MPPVELTRTESGRSAPASRRYRRKNQWPSTCPEFFGGMPARRQRLPGDRMRRLVAKLVLLVLLAALHGPGLLAASWPDLGACCGSKVCPCKRNGRACYCKTKRPRGWWGPQQNCRGCGFALVSGCLAGVVQAEVRAPMRPLSRQSLRSQFESYSRIAFTRARERGPPAGFSST